MKSLKKIVAFIFCVTVSLSFSNVNIVASEEGTDDVPQVAYEVDNKGNIIPDSIKDMREPEVITKNDPKYQNGIALQKKQKERSAAPFVVFRTVTHQTQQNEYYCGPASASMILKYLGYSRSQSALAGSTSSPTMLQTNFYKNTPAGQSVADALNSVVSGSRYRFYWVWHNYTDVPMIMFYIA